MESLYTTKVTNVGGSNGSTSADNGPEFQVASARGSREGLNPEQFMGYAWSTCLNSTLQSVLKMKGLERQSRVMVEVNLVREPVGSGLYFDLCAFISIEGMDEKDAMVVAHQAHKICPVSKLIQANELVRIEYLKY